MKRGSIFIFILALSFFSYTSGFATAASGYQRENPDRQEQTTEDDVLEAMKSDAVVVGGVLLLYLFGSGMKDATSSPDQGSGQGSYGGTPSSSYDDDKDDWQDQPREDTSIGCAWGDRAVLSQVSNESE